MFASRGLHPAERNMLKNSSMKLELLALKWAITEKFREYLLGVKFTVFTDNNPLSYLQTAKLGVVEQRWASQLALFDFVLKYQPGASNRKADALSRHPSPPSTGPFSDVVPGISVPVPAGASQGGVVQTVLAIDAFPVRQKAELRTLQAADPTIGQFLQYWGRGEPPTADERRKELTEVLELVRQWRKIRDCSGVLYRVFYPPSGGKEVLQLLLPKCLQMEVLVALHDQGCERTTSLVRDRCYWPNLRRDVEWWCQECERCVMAKAVQPKVRTFMGHLLAFKPLVVVAIDFTVLERTSDCQENVMVVTDVFSKFTKAYPTPDQKASTVAHVLSEGWFYVYGILQRLHSDQGSNFEGELLKGLCQVYNIQKSRSTPYHPEGNGQCEQFNRTLHDLLRTLPPEKKRKWSQHLPQVLFAYNTTVHQSTGYSPYELMFGRKPHLPVDALLGVTEECSRAAPLEDWVEEHQEHLRSTYAEARRHLEAAAARRARQEPEAKIASLLKGTVVCRQNHVQGRNKIQV